jgi:molybdenum cofactor cytidylyltransferase
VDNETNGPVAGVVLAAGASTRMGRNKLLLRIGGESLVRRAARRALAAGLDPVIVVVGNEAQRSRQELSGLSCRVVENPDFEKGIHLSLRAGIAAVPPEATAAVVVLADMPLVTDQMMGALVERFRESGATLAISTYGGVQAPPTLYERRLFEELKAAEGEGCSKRVIERHRGEAVSVAWPAAALTDVDRPEDFERIRQELSAEETPCAPTC